MIEVIVTRFAPSPTGHLHLGHAFSAKFAREHGDICLLRIEDIDSTRCRQEYTEQIIDDLDWLGLRFDGTVERQSNRMPLYEQAIGRLTEMGLTYYCTCTRRAITEASASAQAQGAVPRYPGTCRGQTKPTSDRPFCIRLNMSLAAGLVGPELQWQDTRSGFEKSQVLGLDDFVLARKEVPTSYHVSVVVDDAAQGVSLVTRGQDLFDSTPPQRVLQELLGLPVPDYMHHPLIVDASGQKLAKRKHSTSILDLRQDGLSPIEVWDMVGLCLQ